MTKEPLSRSFSLKIQTENHLERITRLKSKAQFPEMRENDGSSRNPGAGDPTTTFGKIPAKGRQKWEFASVKISRRPNPATSGTPSGRILFFSGACPPSYL